MAIIPLHLLKAVELYISLLRFIYGIIVKYDRGNETFRNQFFQLSMFLIA